MCGIAGIVQLGGGAASVNREHLEAMCRALAHRGPDDQGVHVDGGVGLGNRRLAVIDPSPAGHQPLSNEDGTVWITYNGEVYNFPELREELARAGHVFRSDTDTETLVHGYEEHGVGVLEQLNGMFGLALWDAPRRRLVLARDGAGKKPLYYYRDGHRLLFASELRALLAGAPDLDLTIDRAALHQYLIFGDFPAPVTPFERVRKLRAGEHLVLEGGAVHTGTHWKPPADATVDMSEEDALDELDDLLRASVQRRLIADVPLGAFLSGGIDSTCVASVAAELTSGPLKTFSIGFEDERFDESRYARRVAEHLGTDHHELVLHEGEVSAADVTRIMGGFDEPFYDHSAIPTYYVSELARRDVTVVLSGDGGDELFVGYEHLGVQAAFYARRPDLMPGPARWRDRALGGLRRALPIGARGDWADAYVRMWPRMPAEGRTALLGASNEHDAAELLRSMNGWSEAEQPVERLARLDFRNYLANDILVKVDRMTMAHSLEARVPLLDRELVEFAGRVPLGLKTAGGEGKLLLKRHLQRRLGDGELYRDVTRSKHGFRFPIGGYVDGPLRPQIADGLRTQRFQEQLGLQGAEIERVLDDHYERRGGGKSLWMLFCLYLWWERTLATPSRSSA